MRYRFHRFSAWLPLASLLLPTPAVASWSATDAARIDVCVRAALDRGDSAGYVIGVMAGDRSVFAHAYGLADRAKSVPMSRDSVLRVGSITKQFTSAAIQLLVERGKIDLNAPVSRYLTVPHGDEIHISDLLQHISGIHNYTSMLDFYGSFADRPHDGQDMLQTITGQQPFLDFQPGTTWRYSNSNYILLGLIIERVSGQHYADFINSNIIRPLGMRHSAIDSEGAVIAGRAIGYVRKDGALVDSGHVSPSAAGAAGALRTTLPDLERWMKALDHGPFLSAASRARMTTPARLRDGSIAPVGKGGAYGMGLMLRDDEGRAVVGHGGTIRGFNAAAYRYSDGTTIVLLANADGAADALIGPLSDVLVPAGPTTVQRTHACTE